MYERLSGSLANTLVKDQWLEPIATVRLSFRCGLRPPSGFILNIYDVLLMLIEPVGNDTRPQRCHLMQSSLCVTNAPFRERVGFGT